ncbi:MAG: DUF1343 domain-containing protein [Betaproteobacteria bacterium]|nr:DUF1343 domain-containing protein [Betaproteobacteria bacterium]
MSAALRMLMAGLALAMPSPALAVPSGPSLEGALGEITGIVRREVALGSIPGAVVIVGNRERDLLRLAAGHRALAPRREPMTEDTVFDLASLTKVVCTAPAVIQLAERGKLVLDAPAARYWPAFRRNGKDAITVRQLLTHYSGLRAGLAHGGGSGPGAALRRVAAENPAATPGAAYLYSDINFIVLGELVRRASGLTLDRYCARHLFRPLGMTHTQFRLARGLRGKIAPTEFRGGRLLRGEVHDPTARRMGGVAGHAGLFSAADDLAAFARMLLAGGRSDGTRVLAPESISAMLAPQSPPGAPRQRGLGWDIGSGNGNGTLPAGFAGHAGYTGTSLWLDPVSDLFLIVLTNRVHPDGRGNVKPLRQAIAERVSDVLGRIPEKPPLLTGTDMLEAQAFAPLAGLRVGLVTNHTGRDRWGRGTAELLAQAPGVTLAALFVPEHGMEGRLEGKIPSSYDAAKRVPVHSLYGDNLRPTEAMLEGLDALVFDLQDAGARFYTYIATLAYAMEAAAQRGIPVFVLDRPNPLGDAVQGPVLEPQLKSFTGYFPMPVRHGMTVGELACLFNAENGIGAKLRVIRMRGYEHRPWFDETGLPWVAPSPNLRTLAQATLYPGVALVEGANVSVGRGTETPFERVGAPWTDGAALADYLNARNIPGVAFAAADFRPEAGPYAGRRVGGVRIRIEDRDALDAPLLGVEIASALQRLYPGEFQLEKALPILGAPWVVQALRKGEDPRAIARRWEEPLAAFRALRARYLLYPAPAEGATACAG